MHQRRRQALDVGSMAACVARRSPGSIIPTAGIAGYPSVEVEMGELVKIDSLTRAGGLGVGKFKMRFSFPRELWLPGRNPTGV